MARTPRRAARKSGSAACAPVPAVPIVAIAPPVPAGDAVMHAAPQACPPAVETLLGPPPLVDGEDGESFDALMAQISADVGPTDSLEMVWVDDVVNLVWEIRRLRRLKVSLMTASAHLGIEKTLGALLDWLPAQELTRRWTAHETSAVAQVEGLIAQAGLTADAVAAEAFAARINEIERIDRMIKTAMMRRDAVLWHVERYRAVTAERLRRASEAAASYVAATRRAA